MVVINVVDLLANINILCETAKYIAKNIRKKSLYCNSPTQYLLPVS